MGTKVAITSLLLALISMGCVRIDKSDTGKNTLSITEGVTTVCSTKATATTNTTTSTAEKPSTLCTGVITTTPTTTMAVTTTKKISTRATTNNYITLTKKPIIWNSSKPTISVVNTTLTTIPTTITTTTKQEEYVVYKPSTYYIHRNTCRWVDNTTYEITDTINIEARKCTECNPNMEIINEYIPSVPESGLPITETERILLCNLVGREYGSDWVYIPEKAKVVAVVMNRVNDSRFPNTIYDVLTQPYQFSGYVPYYSYTYQVTDSVIKAVDYYFAHPTEFGNWLYFEGDGTWNYFY